LYTPPTFSTPPTLSTPPTPSIQSTPYTSLSQVEDIFSNRTVCVGLMGYACGSTIVIFYISVVLILYYKRLKFYKRELSILQNNLRNTNSVTVNDYSESFQSVSSFE
jgi:hypothetical protein